MSHPSQNQYFDLLILATLVVPLACSGPAADDAAPPAASRYEAKHEPLQDYLDLRVGPHGRADVDAYVGAITAAVREESAALRRGAQRPAGFDAPWRVEGPDNLGGRVNVLAPDPRDERRAYLGFSRGGLWTTRDAGTTWAPLTEGLPFPTIGAIALDTVADRLWIGTGDPNVSGYWHIGDGVYYSDDDGATWQHAGLERSGVISKLIVDPRDPDVVFAAVMGRPYEASADRGVYRTDNRGATWTQLFAIADDTGASDLWMSPDDPETLFVTGWPRVRLPDRSVLSGDDAQLYRSTDGGATWASLHDSIGYALPASRLGFAIAPSDARTLYLSVTGADAEFDSFYRSLDGGDSWELMCDEGSPGLEIDGFRARPFLNFGWFFGQTRVDPNDPAHVWMLGVELYESFDGGATWAYDDDSSDEWFATHADKHSLEVTPGGRVWLGTDGGAYRRNLDGRFWSDVESIPTNMVYRVADYPFDTVSAACGMQDNGTGIGGDLASGGYFDKIFGGDGFQPTFFPEEPAVAVVETQRGRLWYLDPGNGIFDEISPPHADEQKSWDMPVASFPNPGTENTRLLTASNYPYEGYPDEFMVWNRDDVLLTSDPDSRYLVATAAHVAADNARYIGTSEGWLWRKGPRAGDTWQRLATGFPERYVTDVSTAPEAPQTVFVTMSEYYSGDRAPYLIRSDDAGATWRDASADLPRVALNSVLSIPAGDNADDALVVGSDIGVFASVDGGASYARLGDGMTNVPIMDLAYDSAARRLIAGTYGRSVQSFPLGRILPADTVAVSAPEVPYVSAPRVRVYPNPASDYVTVEVRLNEVDRDAHLQVFDASGRELLRRTVVPSGIVLRERLDLPPTLTRGVYRVVVRNRHDVHAGSFAVE